MDGWKKDGGAGERERVASAPEYDDLLKILKV